MTQRFVPPDGIAYAAVILDRPAPPGGVSVVLESLDVGVVTVPASVLLEEAWIGAEFPITYVAVGATQVRASLDALEAFIDITCAGTLPFVKPSAALILVELKPDGTVAEDDSTRPAAEVASELRPGEGVAVEQAGDVPRPRVGKPLRPKPYFAGE
jgi:hypothetical protein